MTCLISGSKSISVVCGVSLCLCVCERVFFSFVSILCGSKIYSGHRRRLSAVQNLDRITYSRTLCVCVCVCGACILGYGNRICLDATAYLHPINVCIYIFGTHTKPKQEEEEERKNWISIAEPRSKWSLYLVLFCLSLWSPLLPHALSQFLLSLFAAVRVCAYLLHSIGGVRAFDKRKNHIHLDIWMLMI